MKPPNSSHPWGDTPEVELTGNPVFRMTKEKAHSEYKTLPRIIYIKVPRNDKLNIMPAGEGENFQYHKKVESGFGAERKWIDKGHII